MSVSKHFVKRDYMIFIQYEFGKELKRHSYTHTHTHTHIHTYIYIFPSPRKNKNQKENEKTGLASLSK